MKRRIIITLSVILMLSLLNTGSVQAKGNCKVGTLAYPTIQSAVDDVTCSRIDIPTGTFYENVNIHRDVIMQGKGKKTIVDGGGIDTVFVITGGSVIIKHVAIIHGDGRGGGIYNNGGILFLEDCTISENTALTWPNDYGGGIFNYGSSNLTVHKCLITNNRATFGSGIMNAGGTVSVENSVITKNDSTYAGGIYNNSGSITLYKSTISNNTANEGAGGGMYNQVGILMVEDSIITENTTTEGGGGIYSGDKLVVVNSTITNNVSTGHEGTYSPGGGGIYNAGTLTIQSSEISGNTVNGGDGGGIYNGSAATVQYCMINNNTAVKSTVEPDFGGHGGGIYNGGTLNIIKTEVTANIPDNIYP